MNDKNIISKFVDTAKAVFKKKFIEVSISITKKERSQINDPSFKFKKQEKEFNPKQTEGRKQ